MRRAIIALTLLLSVAALVTATYAALSQRRIMDRLGRAVQALGEQREADSARDEQRRQDNRWFNLLMRAQESPWVGSEGAPVQCRLTVESDVTSASEPVRILVEVRNASDQAQTVGGILCAPFTLRLTHDGQEAKYVGPWPSTSPPMPVTLPPGRIMRQTVTLTSEQFVELGSPGLFAVEFTYLSEAYPPKVTWAGKLPVVRVEWQAK